MPEAGPAAGRPAGGRPGRRPRSGRPARPAPAGPRPLRSRQCGQSPAGAFAGRERRNGDRRRRPSSGLLIRVGPTSRARSAARTPSDPSIKQRRAVVTGLREISPRLRPRGRRKVPDLVIDLGRIVERGGDLLAEQHAVAAAEAMDGDPAAPSVVPSRGGDRRVGGRPRGPPSRTPRSASNVAALPASSYSRPSWSRTRPSRVSAQLRSKIRSGVSSSAGSRA